MGSMFQSKSSAPLQAKAAVRQDQPERGMQTGPVKAPPKFGFASEEKTVQKKSLLSEKKLVAARAFYAGNTTDFSAEIINQIQAKLGIAETGAMDDATLQAVAKFQKDSGQSADGMLGAHSLPKLFTHGLATEETEKEFAQDYLGVDWSSLHTAAERGGAMVNLINKQLKAAGVPECAIRVADLGENSGQFSFNDWTIEVGNDFLSKKKLSRYQLNDFANTIIHEARHAEQWFNMAQKLAGEGKNAKEIVADMGIPLNIAKAAVADPIKTSTVKFLVAKNWYESVEGAGSDHREKTLGDDGSYEDYRNLPEEHDAWRVGDEFNKTLKTERKVKAKKDAAEKRAARKEAREKKKQK